MNQLHLFIFAFLAVCFFLVLIQRDLTLGQRISLLINPALLSLCILVLMSKTADEQKCAAEIAPPAEAVSHILSGDNAAAKKAAAARIRQFIGDGNWQTLGEDLEKIRKSTPRN